MAPAAPIVISTIGMPSLFPMRHDDLESHRADRLFSPCRLGRLKARSTAFPSLVWCEPTIVRTSSAFVATPDWGHTPLVMKTSQVSPKTFRGTFLAHGAERMRRNLELSEKAKTIQYECAPAFLEFRCAFSESAMKIVLLGGIDASLWGIDASLMLYDRALADKATAAGGRLGTV